MGFYLHKDRPILYYQFLMNVPSTLQKKDMTIPFSPIHHNKHQNKLNKKKINFYLMYEKVLNKN